MKQAIIAISILLLGALGLAFYRTTVFAQLTSSLPLHQVDPKTHLITNRENKTAPKTPAVSPNPTPDPDLKPGFPVQTYERGGTYHGGPAVHTLVANIDSDPQLETIVTALAVGPLYAFKPDGSLVAGWPVAGGLGAGYAAVGKVASESAVFTGYFGTTGASQMGIYNGAGVFLPGWPRTSSNYIATPPALADVDGDGQDEMFLEEEDWCLHAYRVNGTVLPGWPKCNTLGGQEMHTPAIADIDNNPSNGLEIVSASGSITSGVFLFAYHANGTPVAGFPVNINPSGYGYPDTFPVIGDVDGDGQVEIVTLNQNWPNPFQIKIFSGNGTLKRTINGLNNNLSYGTAPALADLDCDNFPEIVVQSDDSVYVWKGDGTAFPGWPQSVGSGFWAGSSSPVVGDVDGDGYPDIAVTYYDYYYSGRYDHVRLYNRSGIVNSHFPKYIHVGDGAVPAIADVDLDGRNDLIVTGSYWDGFSGMKDKVWMYDLHGKSYGHIGWGQFGGDAKHTNAYIPPPYGSSECFRK